MTSWTWRWTDKEEEEVRVHLRDLLLTIQEDQTPNKSRSSQPLRLHQSRTPPLIPMHSMQGSAAHLRTVRSTDTLPASRLILTMGTGRVVQRDNV
jgi:hypothetical protein